MPAYKFQQSPSFRAWEDTRKWLVNSFIAWIIVALGFGVVGAIFIPTIDTIWFRALWGLIGAIVGLFLIVGITYIVHLPLALVRQRNEAYVELQKYEGKDDETTQIINRLIGIKLKLESCDSNYLGMLMKYKNELTVGGLGITPHFNPNRRKLCGVDEWKEEAPYKGMLYGQMIEFLQKLTIEGIVEVRRGKECRGYQDYEETFYLTEFGRNVVKRIEKIGILNLDK